MLLWFGIANTGNSVHSINSSFTGKHENIYAYFVLKAALHASNSTYLRDSTFDC